MIKQYMYAASYTSLFCGVTLITPSNAGRHGMEIAVRIAEITSERYICVTNDLLVPALSFLPTIPAVITLNPAVHPKANCRKINVRGKVSFTPATCSAESTCPQIIASVST